VWTVWLVDWLTGWLGGRVWVIVYLCDCTVWWVTRWLNGWLGVTVWVWLRDCMTGWLGDFLDVRLGDWWLGAWELTGLSRKGVHFGRCAPERLKKRLHKCKGSTAAKCVTIRVQFWCLLRLGQRQPLPPVTRNIFYGWPLTRLKIPWAALTSTASGNRVKKALFRVKGEWWRDSGDSDVTTVTMSHLPSLYTRQPHAIHCARTSV
jgi:hypothetical protein